MTESQRRIAGVFLCAYSERLGNASCNDWTWPDWFPVAEREPMVRAMEAWNGSDPADVADAVARTAGEYGPPDFYIASFLAHLLGVEP